MYDQFFSFMGLREDPFHVSPDPRFYYFTPAHESALAELMFGIETRQGILLLTGEAGTGKTSLLNQILDWLKLHHRSTAYVFHTQLEPIGLLRFILAEFGVPCESRSKSELVQALYSWLLRRHTLSDLPVLILDEAQALPVQTLDELRLLLNLETPRGKLLQIILAGQPELEEKLRCTELRQLRQRIMFRSRLPLLSHKETAEYISSRLAAAGSPDSPLFPEEVVRDIYTSSRGIPRLVNLLCEHALISAYAEQRHVVSTEMVQRIAVDFELCSNPAAIPDLELQPKHARLAPFPVFENVKPPAAGLPAVGTENPIPTVAPPLPTYSRRRWRKYRSHSAIATFARKFRTSVQRLWNSFHDELGQTLRYAQVALLSLADKPRKRKMADRNRVPAWCEQIDFDISRRAARRVVRTAVAAQLGESWRKYQTLLAVFPLNSGNSVGRVWKRFAAPTMGYFKSIFQSFVHDCRMLFRVPGQPARALNLYPNKTRALESQRSRNFFFFAKIANWLRQPMKPAEKHSLPHPTRSKLSRYADDEQAYSDTD